MAACTAAEAAQRVLIDFSESGFAVVKVVSVPGIDYNRSVDDDGTGQKPGFTNVADAIESLKPGQAMLIWQNEKLEWLHVSTFDDPRIVQSPMHATSVIDSRAGLARGAWIADGPDDAERVVLLIAENQLLGLQFEQWPLWLQE
ncbi:MAG: hypothetical protein AB8B63_09445 [Granulosicoccus sp.]